MEGGGHGRESRKMEKNIAILTECLWFDIRTK